MKKQRDSYTKHILKQYQKARTIPADVAFNRATVDVIDIVENVRWYPGFLLVPNVVARYISHGRKTAAAVATHFDGMGPESCGTTVEVVINDTKMDIFRVFFAHFVSQECHEYCETFFEECYLVDGYDLPIHKTILRHEKKHSLSIQRGHENAKMFLDPMHVRKKMSAELGAKRAVGI